MKKSNKGSIGFWPLLLLFIIGLILAGATPWEWILLPFLPLIIIVGIVIVVILVAIVMTLCKK